MKVCEAGTDPMQFIEIGSWEIGISMAGQISISLIINNDEQDIGSLSLEGKSDQEIIGPAEQSFFLLPQNPNVSITNRVAVVL